MALVPLISLIALGYAFKHFHFLSEEFWRGAERLNYFILFPILLFKNLAFVSLELTNLVWVIGAMLMTILLVSCALWLAKFYFHIKPAQFGVYVQSHIRFNTYMGLALVSSLFGAYGLKIFAMMIAIAIPTVNIISLLAFAQQNHSIQNTLLAIVKNPLIIGCIVGLLFNLTGLDLATGLHDLISLLASVSLPLGLLAVGAALQFQALKLDIWRLSLNSLGRLLVVPLLAYGVTQVLALPTLESLIVLTFFALPTASAAYILTRYLKGNHQLMAGVISLQTVLFVLSFPLLMYFFKI